MKLFIILLLIIILGFLVFVKKPMEQQEEEEFNKLPVYIDPRTVYLNEPILYDEWPQAPCEISSSL